MSYKRILALLVTMGILLLGTSQVTGQQNEPQSPQGTYGSAFTYQGQLKGPSGAVNGTCDLRFRLFDAAGGGSQVGGTVTHEGVELVDGLFTARLDFGGVHDGNARWLEVAVRCPAGSGGYVTLSPRQELTGAPAALSLALPFLADVNLGGPLLWIENNGVGEAAGFESVGGIALWVEAPASEGVHVATAGLDGVHVVNAGGQGLAVDSAGSNGVYVASAGADGVKVSMAGSPSMAASDYKANGFEIGGAQGDGLFVGRADVNGIRVGSAGNDGVYVGIVGNPSNVILDPARDGFEVAGAEGNGLSVGRADQHGVSVASAGKTGVGVGNAAEAGVYVGTVGSPSTSIVDPLFSGFTVTGAQGHGLFVGRADDTGVYVRQAGADGVRVHSAGDNAFEVTSSAGQNGLYVNMAVSTGVLVHQSGWNGMVVEMAGGDGVRATNTVYNALYGDTANAQGEWGLYTPDKVHAQNVTLQTLTLVAQVTGPDALSAGDIVAAAGVAAPRPDSGAPLPLVRLAAAGWNGVVGVVEGRLALSPVPQPEGEEAPPRLELRSAEGPARPGDYVALTILGVAQIKVDVGLAAIDPGMRLTSGTGGRARALKTVVVEGVTLSESAPMLGIALAAPDKDGFVWVLVNPQ